MSELELRLIVHSRIVTTIFDGYPNDVLHKFMDFAMTRN